jgi:hypothetical protein
VGSVAAASPANASLKRTVAGIPSNSLIYSNEPDEVYYLSGRTVYLLPNIRSASTLKMNHGFASEMSSLKRTACGKRATVFYLLSNSELEPSLLQVEQDLKVASVSSIPNWKVLTLDTDSC